MITNYKTAVENIQQQLKTYIQENKLQALVVGISGGIDSALCCALAYPICTELKIPLIGRSISIVTNKADEKQRAQAIGQHYVHNFQEVDLSSNFELLAKLSMESDPEEDTETVAYKIRLGNIKARTRMIYLYDLAAKHKGMVLSTDNFTELMLGFWTLHGDVGDYGMIQNLWKTEVYDMATYLAEQNPNKAAAKALTDCVEAVATDGLGITNSDLDQLQANSYAEVDKILIKYLSANPDVGEYANHPVVRRKENSEYKRNNPYNIPREQITDIKAF